MPATVADRNRAIRREAFRERMVIENHYRRFLDGMEKLRLLAESESDVDDRKFAKWLKVVEKEWNVCAAYMPKPKSDDGERPAEDEGGISEVRRALARITGQAAQTSSTASLPDRSVVPVALRPETGGSGDTGSES